MYLCLQDDSGGMKDIEVAEGRRDRIHQQTSNWDVDSSNKGHRSKSFL